MDEPLLQKEPSEKKRLRNSYRENGKNSQTISIWKLFQFASKLDVLMISIGILSSTIAGMSFPLIMVVIGLAITQFTDFTVAERIVTASFNTSRNISFNYFCPNAIDQGFFDYVKSSDPDEKLRTEVLLLTYGMLAVGVGYFTSTFVAVVMWSVSSINQEERIRITFIKSVLNQDISHYDTHPPTELPSLLTDDIKKIGIGLGVQWDSVISQLSSIFSGFIIALYFNWKLTLAISAFIPPLLVLLVVLGKVIASVTAKEQNVLSSASSLAEQILFSIKTVMAFGGQSIEWKRYDRLLQKAHYHSYLKSIITGTVFAIYNLVLFLIFSIGFWYGGKLFVDCGVEVGDVIIVVFEVSVVTLAFGYLVLPLTAIGVAIGSATNVFAVIKEGPQDSLLQMGEGTTIDHFEGSIQINGVSFSYPSRPHVPILTGIDLTVKPGKTVALVGPSGCGKSTIIKLLQRIYDFGGGSILLDGHDIRQLDIHWLRNQIGVVSQEPILFNLTVAENIGYGKNTATRNEIEAAAKAANAHDFISSLPNGYSTLVGEGGSQLSGGQKQRIAIARALIRDPKILFLDEATSALDMESEKAVQDSLDKAQLNRTTIIIAHRLATIQSADVIVAIDKGQIVEMGSHDSLLANRSLYYKLVTEQSIEEKEQTGYKKGAMRRFYKAKARSGSKGRSRSFSLTNPLQSYSRSRAITFDSNALDIHPHLHHHNFTDEKVEEALNYVFIDKSFISLEDMNGIVESTRPPSFKQLLVLAKDDWWMIALGTLSFCIIGLELSTLYILMSESLKVFARDDADSVTQGLLLYIYLYAGLGVLGFILHIFGTICLGVAADHLTKRIRSQCFQCMLKQDPTFFDKQDHSVSALVSMLAIDAANINQITGIPVGFAVRVLCSAIASIVISLQSSWVLSCVLLPSYIVLCASAFFQVQIGRFISNRTSQYLETAYKTAIEAIENVYTVSSLGIPSKFVEKCRNQFAKTTRLTKLNTIFFGSLFAFSQSFIYFATSAAISIGAIIYIKDNSSPYHADLVDIFQAIMSVVFTSVLFNDAFHALPDTEQAKLSARRVAKLLTQHPIIDALDDGGITPDNTSSGLIEIDDCEFFYPSRPDVSILKGINVRVEPGQTLAIVGPSGSGKSTIASMIERFYDPTAGAIKLDGRNIRDFNISWLRQQISLVSQEPVLFDMSVADNIRYGANFRNVSEDEVHNAAKLANIHEFICSLPQGYNTTVGLKGTQLSGGQKQRVAIARALIRNPKILLLDEATSALDTESEKVVQDALDQARVGRTTIIIAHRLSTIYNSNTIVVLRNGQVVEQGTHSQLMDNTNGVYYKMNTAQELT